MLRHLATGHHPLRYFSLSVPFAPPCSVSLHPVYLLPPWEVLSMLTVMESQGLDTRPAGDVSNATSCGREQAVAITTNNLQLVFDWSDHATLRRSLCALTLRTSWPVLPHFTPLLQASYQKFAGRTGMSRMKFYQVGLSHSWNGRSQYFAVGAMYRLTR